MKINLCNPGYKFKIANKCLLKKSEMTQNDVKENEILENPNSCYNRQLIELQFSGIKKNKQPTLIERSKGCLHGGAAGDALGAKLEWLSVENIKKIYGESGLRYIPKRNGEYRITDDTQMTLFTSEGLLNSFLKTLDIECEPNYNDIYNSYLNWYTTQIEESPKDFCSSKLLQDKAFYSPRFPGKTCLEALKNKTMGTLDEPINDSMGNGGIM